MSFRSPPPLADDVIDRLFTRLVVRYGDAFTARWRELDLDIVKGDWARELARFGGHNIAAIAFALERLSEKPPTVIDFRKLCEAAPPVQAALPNSAPVRGPNAYERQKLAELREMFRHPPKPNKDWAHRLIARHESGDHRPPMCVAMARRAIGAATFTEDIE